MHLVSCILQRCATSCILYPPNPCFSLYPTHTSCVLYPAPFLLLTVSCILTLPCFSLYHIYCPMVTAMPCIQYPARPRYSLNFVSCPTTATPCVLYPAPLYFLLYIYILHPVPSLLPPVFCLLPHHCYSLYPVSPYPCCFLYPVSCPAPGY
jgi:hypothetical protein